MLSRIHLPVMTVLPVAGATRPKRTGASRRAIKTWIFTQAVGLNEKLNAWD
jgi:hypothetical protein